MINSKQAFSKQLSQFTPSTRKFCKIVFNCKCVLGNPQQKSVTKTFNRKASVSNKLFGNLAFQTRTKEIHRCKICKPSRFEPNRRQPVQMIVRCI